MEAIHVPPALPARGGIYSPVRTDSHEAPSARPGTIPSRPKGRLTMEKTHFATTGQRRRLGRSSLCAAALAMVVAGVSAAATPRAIFNDLLASPPTGNQKWAGSYMFNGSHVGELTANSKRHGAIGKVIYVFSSRYDARVAFIVFPTARAARAAWGKSNAAAVPSLPRPSELRNGSWKPDGTPWGFSYVGYLSGALIVEATTVAPNAKSGDVAAAIELAKWTRGHLARVRSRTD